MKMRKNRLSLALACLMLTACEGESDAVYPQTESQKPVPLEGSLLYLSNEDGHAQVRLVHVSKSTPRIAEYALPGGLALSRARPQSAGKQAIVLTHGVEAAVVDGKARESIASHLILYNRDGELYRKELGGRFSELTVSEDGRTAVAHGEQPGVGWGNTVSIIDLDNVDAPPRNVPLSDNTGRPPRSFDFPRIEDKTSRRLMLVRGFDSVRLIDLDHLERPTKEIPLTTADDFRSLQAGKAIFQPDAIFLQLLGSPDVLVLQLIAGDKGAFTVTPLTLATASTVRDIELIGEGDELRLVAVGNDSISVVDPVTANATTTATPGGGFSDMIPFAGRSPYEDVMRERGLLISAQGRRIAFVDFDEGSAWSQQAFEPLELAEVVESSIPVLDHGFVVLLYRTGAMGIVDLERRTVTPIRTGASVNDTWLDSSADSAKLWVNLTNARVARIDLLRLETTEVLLNASASSIVMVEGTPRRVAALHESRAGYITLLDPKNPSRESAREFASFFYTDLLD